MPTLMEQNPKNFYRVIITMFYQSKNINICSPYPAIQLHQLAIGSPSSLIFILGETFPLNRMILDFVDKYYILYTLVYRYLCTDYSI